MRIRPPAQIHLVSEPNPLPPSGVKGTVVGGGAGVGIGGGSKGRRPRQAVATTVMGAERAGAATYLIAVIIIVATIVGIVTVGAILCASVRTRDLRSLNDKAWCGRDVRRCRSPTQRLVGRWRAAPAAERSANAIGAHHRRHSRRRRRRAPTEALPQTPSSALGCRRHRKGYPFDTPMGRRAEGTRASCVADSCRLRRPKPARMRGQAGR